MRILSVHKLNHPPSPTPSLQLSQSFPNHPTTGSIPPQYHLNISLPIPAAGHSPSCKGPHLSPPQATFPSAPFSGESIVPEDNPVVLPPEDAWEAEKGVVPFYCLQAFLLGGNGRGRRHRGVGRIICFSVRRDESLEDGRRRYL